MKYYPILDVGGTGIKGGVLTESGALLGDIVSFDARAREDKETILQNLCHVICTLYQQVQDCNKTLGGVGFSFPGPFDYQRGISLMKGLNKYDSIYGVDLKAELRARLGKALGTPCSLPLLFLHDVEAFALGEMRMGLAKGFDKVLYLCIGTGAGSAFSRGGEILKTPEPGVPQNGWIYATPFGESIIDDYISARGLQALALKHTGQRLDGLALAKLAQQGDTGAQEAFAQFGNHLAQAMESFLAQLCPNALVLGGQICKSFDLFGGPLTAICRQRGVTVLQAHNTSESVLKGIFSLLRV